MSVLSNFFGGTKKLEHRKSIAGLLMQTKIIQEHFALFTTTGSPGIEVF